ncbi:MAG: nitrous oxide reductase family maturation protein NosD [Promethearchaeota archaeon]
MELSQDGPPAQILIVGNNDFTVQGWPGNGTNDDPYRIDDLVIGTTETAIRVINVTCHFIIFNCTFYSTGDTWYGQSIEFYNVTNGKVAQCRFDTIHLGIWVEDSSDCVISNSSLDRTNIPIVLIHCQDSTIFNNTIMGNDLYLRNCTNCVVERNWQIGLSDEYPTHGFYFSESRGCIVRNNTVANDDYGVWFEDMESCVFDDNRLYNCGLYFATYELQHYNIETHNNFVNGKPLGFFNGHGEITLDGSQYGQMVLVGCSGTLVKNGQFDNTTVGAIVAYSSGCTLTNITISSSVYGIKFLETTDCNVTSSTVSENLEGIYCEVISNMNIENNTVVQNTQNGIYLGVGSQNRVVRNLVTDNAGVGIVVEGQQNQIYYNTLGRNGQNAYDGGANNQWDDGNSVGNFWDDMTPGEVYAISGSAGSVDRFPNGTAAWTPLPLTNIIVASGISIILVGALVLYLRRR